MGGKSIDHMLEMKQREQGINPEELPLEERLIQAKRTTRVTEGGRRFSFSALVVIGDRKGHVGFGLGKAKEVPLAIAKAIQDAKKKLIRVPIINGTVPHEVIGHYGPTKIIIMPARRGTGIVAGGAAKPVFELAGYTDVLTKIIGSTNPHNVLRAVFDAFLQMETPEEVAAKRGKPVEEILKEHKLYATKRYKHIRLY